LAWLAETAVATVKVRNFRNRGFASGPFCFLYGVTGVISALWGLLGFLAVQYGNGIILGVYRSLSGIVGKAVI